MRFIVVTNVKGGVAKSTTSMFLAFAARRRGRQVLVVDADRSYPSSYDWWTQATEAGHRDPSMHVTVAHNPADLATTISTAIPDTWDLDRTLCVIDCPPSKDNVIRGAMAWADLIVVPTSPMPMDVREAGPTLDLAAEVNNQRALDGDLPIPVVGLPVKVRTQTLEAREIHEAMTAAGFVCPRTIIGERIDIARAYGRVPQRLHGYDLLWDEIAALETAA